MDYLLKVVALLVTASAIAIHLLARARKSCRTNLPPGSLGLPVLGQTLGFLRAMRGNSLDRWVRDRVDRYGPVSKLSLLGSSTVLLTGPAANKFIFFSGVLDTTQTWYLKRLFGEKTIADLHGDDYRRIRGALMEFLKPDMLKLYIGRIDAEVRHHLEENWYGRTTVTVMPLMKRLSFANIAALIFGLKTGDALAVDLRRTLDGMFAIPVNLPFTRFGRSLKASRRARQVLEGITVDKRANLGQGKASTNNNLITHLLSLMDDHGEHLLTNEEIIDTCMSTLLGGHDSPSVLITFIVRHLANDPATLTTMRQEHEEIARNKAQGEALTWEDLSKMKFTWRVAQETLRLVPPVLGNFRTALEDTEFDGYFIPKGWQVFWTANVTHMDTRIFHEPARFDPSRFENRSSTTPPCSFVAFGGGPRLCPGIEFTRIETLVTMHYLVRQFRWNLCCEENTFVMTPFPSPLHGLPIELEHMTSL
ncbi:hypothetical protein ACQ4PT_011601 [Festuca glaucescens]